MRRLLPCGSAAIFLLALTTLATAQAQVTSTFDSDLEGWLIVGDNNGTWQPTEGNPGGCLDVNDLAVGQGNYASAPAAFLGDWSGMGAGDSLRCDIHFENTSGGALLTSSWIFQIQGPGGSAQALLNQPAPPQGIWTGWAVSLDAADWTVQSGTWQDLLADVTSLKITVEYVNGDEEVRLDNVHLTRSPLFILRPCLASTFEGTTTEDWSAENTGGLSNPGSGGNTGGFLRVGDGSGHGYVLAPGVFLGDWSTFNGTGSFSLDLRLLSRSGVSTGSASFVRLSGPGGVARVELDAADLPVSDRLWRTFSFSLDAGTWTVDSGTWADLLDNVTQVRIDADLFDGSEVLGFDNVGRREDGCPSLLPTVTIYPPGVTICRSWSFVAATTVGRSPLDGTLYTMVRDEGSAKDGVYPFTGPGAHVRLHAFDRPAGLAFDSAGNGYVSEDYNGSIFRFSGAAAPVVWVSGLHAGDDDPFGMVEVPAGFVGPNVGPGDVLVADRGNSGADEVWAFSSTAAEGERLLVADPGNVDWFDVAALDDGTVWLVDALNEAAIQQVAPTGALTSLALSTPISAPRSIVADPQDGLLYVAGPTAIHRVDPMTGQVELVADGFVNLFPASLELHGATRRLWLPDRGANRIYEFCLEGVTATPETAPSRPGRALKVVPNPFNPRTQLRFELEQTATVELTLHDARGRLVRALLHEELGRGSHAVLWDGLDDNGRKLASGVYHARLSLAGQIHGVRLVLLR